MVSSDVAAVILVNVSSTVVLKRDGVGASKDCSEHFVALVGVKDTPMRLHVRARLETLQPI